MQDGIDLRSPDLPSEACVNRALDEHLFGRSSDLQAFYLLQLPGSWLNQCFFLERSFLLTAAGQFRILTGFPFQSTRKEQTPRELQYTVTYC